MRRASGCAATLDAEYTLVIAVCVPPAWNVKFNRSVENMFAPDDPLLRPDEFKLVVKGAGRDVTQQYAVA